ncbi:GGDEF domain-containing protein [Pseudofrankia sp. DC12]|uniref:GGDEF domain-containing protein n=1 Tax=Pseudofrankia sp. DC12 TaxID=683315 RepID=UPI001E4E526D|nr:GGDEF domain-containing protein [Pseudofrankia sp. DC12]
MTSEIDGRVGHWRGRGQGAAPRGGRKPARLVTSLVEAVAQMATAADCLGAVRRVRAMDRRWRRLVDLTACGATVTSLTAAVILLVGGFPTDRGSPVYTVFLVCYGAALVACTVALVGPRSSPTDPADSLRGSETTRPAGCRRYAVALLDCALIAGSIVLLEWETLLGARSRAGKPDLVQLMFVMVAPVASLILATGAVLVAWFGRPRFRAALVVLGAGLIADGVFLYCTAQDRRYFPPWTTGGFAVACLLVLLAGLAPLRPHAHRNGPAPSWPRAMWMDALLPYAVLGACGLLLAGRLSTGGQLDRYETYGMLSLLLVTFARQMVTSSEKTRLLAETRETERELRYQAFHDPLTGLANRTLFTRQLRRALAPDTDAANHSAQPEAPQPVSVLMMDLDEFKRVNDTFGHAVGDELLQISAERLRAGTRTADTVARLGGDEFAIILHGGCSDTPCQVGERLATAVQAPCELAGRLYTPSASFGLVTLDPAALPASPDILLHQADQAMYTAKRARTRKLVIYRPDLPTLTDHRPGSRALDYRPTHLAV